MLISIFLMIIISTSLTVPTQPSPRFHVEAWLPFKNREMDYYYYNGFFSNFGTKRKVDQSKVKWPQKVEKIELYHQFYVCFN